jgi:SAM-dependent methyltransferase
MTLEGHDFVFVCPYCRALLQQIAADKLYCAVDRRSFLRTNGVWRFLTPEMDAYFEPFIHDYEAIRRCEGRGSDDPAYYLALPFEDKGGRHQGDWRVRATSFLTLMHQFFEPLEHKYDRAMNILDLGAGNGWLSNRLGSRGHHVAAIDLAINSFDGLGAHLHYETDFVPLQADFTHLPLKEDQADLAIFNASLHYAASYEESLSEALRVLRHEGQVVIIDTPVYHTASSGNRMVRERESFFQAQYGFPSNRLPSENFLTFDRLEALSRFLNVRWRFFKPDFGLRWRIKRFISHLRACREPASFFLIVGSPHSNSIETA